MEAGSRRSRLPRAPARPSPAVPPRAKSSTSISLFLASEIRLCSALGGYLLLSSLRSSRQWRTSRTGVVLVVDGEVGPIAEESGVLAQHAGARGVKGGDPGPARRSPEKPRHPLFHLPGGLVREGDGQRLVRPDLAALDQIGEPIGENPGLSGARAREHQQRARRVEDGLLLALVEVLCETRAKVRRRVRHRVSRGRTRPRPPAAAGGGCGWLGASATARPGLRLRPRRFPRSSSNSFSSCTTRRTRHLMASATGSGRCV